MSAAVQTTCQCCGSPCTADEFGLVTDNHPCPAPEIVLVQARSPFQMAFMPVPQWVNVKRKSTPLRVFGAGLVAAGAQAAVDGSGGANVIRVEFHHAGVWVETLGGGAYPF